jgi:2-polyprenyl-3-methyl-5-hydroxy-6-metoxy-1,4-benzoquinol methylase
MADQVSGRLSPFLRRRRLAAARPHVARGRILDFGCGVGALAGHVDPARYLGVDLDPASIAAARARHPAHTFLTLEEFEAGGPWGAFHVIAALALLEHLEDPAGWLRSMGRRLAPSGEIVLTTPRPSLRWAHELGARLGLFSREAADEHKAFIDPPAMRSLAATAGLRVQDARSFLWGCNQLFVLVAAPPPAALGAGDRLRGAG